MRCFICATALAGFVALGSNAQENVRLSTEGRFLYADDDDWDWASPLGTKEPCGLSAYGRMPWSALDWMEEGLSEVRGVLIGTPPASGNYLTMADLNRVRKAGPKLGYDQVPHKADILSDLVKDRKPPNVIIMMTDIGLNTGKPPITAADVEAGLEFVRRGGRLLILDDWKYYRDLVSPFVDEKRFGHVGAKQPPDADLKKVVAEKLQQLNSDNFRVREKATAELLKMGLAIVPLLQTHKTNSLEEQRRIDAVLKVLLPPLPKSSQDDGWLAGTATAARKLQPHFEHKTISRNGQKLPGSALCIRLVAAGAALGKQKP